MRSPPHPLHPHPQSLPLTPEMLLDNMNAQRVWEEFATHMTISSKGKAEKHRLHTYVATTVLDKSWKGTTEQFILHLSEQL